MAQKDLGSKTLLGIDEVFCDVAGVLLFHGKSEIKADELEDVDTHSQYHADGKYHEQVRDVAKYWKKQGVCIAMIGIENEAEPEKYMPIRVFSYDGGAYRTQISKNVTKGPVSAESPPDRIYPVITIVLNFSTRTRWNTAKNLLEVVDVPDCLKPFVNDYKINVIDVAFLDREIIDSFESDFRYVADYFWQIRNSGCYNASKEDMKYVYQVLQMMSAMTGDKRFEEAYNEKREKGGDRKMCEYLDMLEERGEKRGEKRGKKEGKKEGKKLERENGIRVLVNVLSEMDLSDEEIVAKVAEKYELTKDESKKKVRKYKIIPA